MDRPRRRCGTTQFAADICSPHSRREQAVDGGVDRRGDAAAAVVPRSEEAVRVDAVELGQALGDVHREASVTQHLRPGFFGDRGDPQIPPECGAEHACDLAFRAGRTDEIDRFANRGRRPERPRDDLADVGGSDHRHQDIGRHGEVVARPRRSATAPAMEAISRSA